MAKYTAIVNVNLEYYFEADNMEKAEEYTRDLELPDNYLCDSFDVIKILKEGE